MSTVLFAFILGGDKYPRTTWLIIRSVKVIIVCKGKDVIQVVSTVPFYEIGLLCECSNH
jgi:hypothetical protein